MACHLQHVTFHKGASSDSLVGMCLEFSIGLIKGLLQNPNSWGVLAERQGEVLGSIFLYEFPPSPVAVIGPLTVHPAEEDSGIGRMLMNAALSQAHKENHDQIRLVQRAL